MDRKSTLITGGARSGKSHFAQELALKSGQMVLFVATATAGDEEMRQRIEEHRRTRPDTWLTLEASSNVGSKIQQNIGSARVVIIDCITLLVNNIFGKYSGPDTELIDEPLVEKDVTTEVNELLDCVKSVDASFIIVTNEVGLGLVPANQMGRLYRDLLGKANQMLSHQVDQVYLMVAGLPVLIKPTSLF